jgi:signal transduction histidine kinase/ActR/RegA family two-component response regulator
MRGKRRAMPITTFVGGYVLATAVNDISGHEVVQNGSDSILAREDLAPRLNWNQMGESEHFVQFYETDVYLLDSLEGFIRAGLEVGDACVVVATGAHRVALEERLRARGLDVAAASASGQFVSLDAAETLAKFMVDGEPEPVRFAEVIGEIIEKAAINGRRVRAFGEMVALLWAEGNSDAAIRLEGLWNELQKTRSFSLFCAYEMGSFGGEQFSEPFSNICTSHSQVIPAESYNRLSNQEDRLRAIIRLQQKAKSLEAEILERKQVEEQLRSSLVREQFARAEADTANRLKDEFLATVSHELRTPLHAVIGWAHMLRNGMLDEAMAARAVETIERNAKSQAQLVEDLLDVSRVIVGKLRLDIAPVDVASVINLAIDSIELAAESKGIKLEVTLDPTARRVSGDSDRLQQAIWNLLTNAIKFTPSGGRVEVRLERVGREAQIKVRDTGQGISQDFLPFIFDCFRQADGTSTRRHGGLGLGLALVRHLVELHGGTIEAASPGEGLGATFTIKLPLATAHERKEGQNHADKALWPADVSAHLKPLPSLDGLQVLLVADDRETSSMLTLMLTRCRAKVLAVSTAGEALEALRWCQPDILVSDLAMPDEDGCSLIHRVKALESATGRRIPAVALTADARVEDRAKALSAGYSMFVPQPVEPNELITAIANLAEPYTAQSLPPRKEPV